jgi:hypothetical protein
MNREASNEALQPTRDAESHGKAVAVLVGPRG